MATELGVAYLSLVADTKQFAGSVRSMLGDMETETRKSSNTAAGIFGGAWKTAAKVGGVAIGGLGAVITGLAAKGGIDRALRVDAAQAKLRGLGHDTKSVEKIMDNALSSVEGTSYTLAEAATTAAGAVAAGIKPGEALEGMLSTVANSAAAAGTDMATMGSIFNKVATVDMAQMDVLNQVADRGLPIYQSLADVMGVTTAEVRKMASAGKIDFKTFEEAMTQSAGTVAEEIGQTLPGRFANLKSAISSLGERAVTQALPHVSDGIAWLTDKVKEARPAAEKLGDTLGKGIGAFAEWMGTTGFPAIKNFLDTLVTLGQEITGVLVPAIQNLVDWVKRNRTVLEPLTVAVGVGTTSWILYRGALSAISKSKAGVTSALGAIRGAVGKLNTTLKANPIGAVIALIAGLVAGLVWFFTKTETGQKIVKKVWGAIKDAIGFVVDWWTNTAQPILVGAWDEIKAAWGAVSDWFRDTFGEAFTAVWEGIKTAAGAVGDWFTGTLAPIFQGAWDGILAAASVVADWYSENLAPVFEAVWGTATDTAKDAAGWYDQHLAPVFEAFGELVQAVMEELVLPVFDTLRTAWETVTKGIADWWGNTLRPTLEDFGGAVKALWNDWVKPSLENLAEGWRILKDAIVEVVGIVGVAIKDFWDKYVSPVLGFVIGLVGAVAAAFWEAWTNYISITFTAMKEGFSVLWTHIKGVWDTIGVVVINVIKTAWEVLKTTLSTIWNAIAIVFSVVWNVMKTTVETILGIIKGVINTITAAIRGDWEGVWDGIRGILDTALGGIRSAIETIFGAVRDFVVKIWDGIKSNTENIWNGIESTVTGVVESVKTSVEDTFSRMATAVGNIWDRIKGAVGRPINVVIGFINDGIIGSYNWVAEKLGIKTLGTISELNLSSASTTRGGGGAPLAAYQDGGYVNLPWSSQRRDPYLGFTPQGMFRFEGEEFIFPRDMARKHRRAFEAMLRGDLEIPQYAGGGAVRPVPGRHSGWNGGRYRSGGWHGGLDFPAATGTPVVAMWPGRVSHLARLNRSYGHHIRIDHGGGLQTLYAHLSQILTSIGAAVSGGSLIGRVGSTGNSTGPHLHLETRIGGRQANPEQYLSGAKQPSGNPIVELSKELGAAISAGFDTVRGWFSGIMDRIREPFEGLLGNLKGSGAFGDLLEGFAGKVREELEAWVKSKLGFAGGTMSAPRGLAWTGERGPELVNFRGGEQVFSAADSLKMLRAGGRNAVNFIEVTGIKYDAVDDFARAIESSQEILEVRRRYSGVG